MRTSSRNKKKILIIFGTRPEAIKLAPVVRELKAHINECTLSICVTAQHRQMLDQVLDIFQIKVDYDLNLMKSNQSLFEITAAVITNLRSVLEEAKPDVILIQGDTTSVLGGALSAFYLKIPIGHIEAGLRTHNKFSPFPEEINRKLCSVLADYHFAPTKINAQNLLKEGIPKNRIFVTGNTIIDTLLWALEIIEGKKQNDFEELKNFELRERTILITGHRRENFGFRFQNIFYAIRHLAEKNEKIDFLYPIHLNPNVRQTAKNILEGLPNIRLIEPLSYLAFVYIMKNSYIILTDSGGIQEEAPTLGIPVLVTRNHTERPEGISAGTVKLAYTDFENIVNTTQRLIDNPKAYSSMSNLQNPYGDGKASKRIASILLDKPWHSFDG